MQPSTYTSVYIRFFLLLLLFFTNSTLFKKNVGKYLWVSCVLIYIAYVKTKQQNKAIISTCSKFKRNHKTGSIL